MKRALSLLLTVVLTVIALTACGGENSPASSVPMANQSPSVEESNPIVEDSQPVGSPNLTQFYSSLRTQYGQSFPADTNLTDLPEMMEDLYPGISAIETRQLLIFLPAMSSVVCEIALVEVVNSTDVDTVKAIFQARIDAQASGGAFYPNSVEGWQNSSRIAVNGNCVMMIACSNCDLVVESFDGLF